MKRYITFLIGILMITACSQDEPQNLPPTVEATAATDITRTSATLNGLIVEHGGPVRRAQFRYGLTADMTQVAQIKAVTGPVSTSVDGLRYNTTYYFCLEAGDPYTLITSAPKTFMTAPRSDTGALWVESPGTLELLFTADESCNVDTLLLSGKLNGDDLRFLRRMLGRDIEGMTTQGRVSVLDMLDAQIISGGVSYDGMHFTEKDVIGQGLFADCIKLKTLKLPATTTAVETDAFKGCTALCELVLPGTVTKVGSSAACTSLQRIIISGNNPYYQSDEGVLMNKGLTLLLWFPQGRKGLFTVPEYVTEIGDGAFSGSLCNQIVLGNQITEIGSGAFAGAQIESMVIPDHLENIRSGLFQGCNQLKSVTLGRETLFLADYIFDGCPLEELHVRASDFIPHCETNTFAGAEQLFSSCKLYVPKGSKKRYQQAPLWSVFRQIVEE